MIRLAANRAMGRWIALTSALSSLALAGPQPASVTYAAGVAEVASPSPRPAEGAPVQGNKPLAYWGFDEVSTDGQVRDRSGNGHDVQLFRAMLVEGKRGMGLRLDGNSGGHAITRLMAGAFRGDFTVALWVNVEGEPREAGIFSALGHRSPGFCLQMNRGEVGVYSGHYSRRALLTTNQWHHVAAVHSSSDGKTGIYVDGELVVDEAQQVATDESVPVTLGRFYTDFDGFYFKGVIDEVRIYAAALDAAGVERDRARASEPGSPPAGEEVVVNVKASDWYAEQVGALPYYWERVTAKAGWSPRDSCGEMVYNNRLWLLGGWYDSSTPGLRDVWSARDGVRWVQATAAAPWRHGDLPTTLVFNGKMWFMGGWYGGRLADASASNQVWSSADGIDWQLVTDHAGWSPRCGAAGVVFKNRMWVLGGLERYLDGNASHQKNDVWSSADGVNWELAVAHAPWAPRAFHQVLVFRDKLWLLGGGNYQPVYQARNDVWCSADGVQWERVMDHAPWSPRIWFSAVVHRERMWVLGGWSNHPSKNWNDVWHTADGMNWRKLRPVWPATVWSPRHEQSAYVLDDKIWIAGGNAYPLVNDVWRLHIADSWRGGD